MSESKVPYAPFPKYGPEAIGQAEYDRQLAAWKAYQASLRSADTAHDRFDEHGTDEYNEMADDTAGTADDAQQRSNDPTENLDTYTYVNRYVKDGQERERIFREQGIMAKDEQDAIQQGRDAMEAELGAEGYSVVEGHEKASKPRGKPFKKGDDPRRADNSGDDDAEGDSGSGADDAEGDGDDEGDGDGDADSEAEADADSEAEGQDGQGGDDDTPQMPTCPECGEPKGSTPGCCQPEAPGEMPMPQPNETPKPDLQLLRLPDAEGVPQPPLMGTEADGRIRDVAHGEVVDVVQKALAGVDDWTRKLVTHDIHAAEVEIYEAMGKLARAMNAKIAKAGGGKAAKLDMAKVEKATEAVVKRLLAQHEKKAGAKLDDDALEEMAISVAELIVDDVVAKLDVPRKIVVQRDSKEVEIDGITHHQFEPALKAVNRGLNLFLVGPAGSGKGFLAQHISQALDMRFGFVSCSEGMSEGMLLGRGVPLAEEFLYLQSSFVDFYENGGVFLLDEIDAANPNVLLIINECLSSPHLSIPNRVEKPYAERHPDFVAIVAANTWGTGPNMEYVGRNRLDAAFLNRFVGSQIELDYDENVERQIAVGYLGDGAKDVLKRFWEIRNKIAANGLRRIWSTRGLEKMCIALADGDDMATVLDAHTRGWTPDEKSKVGI